MGRKGEMVQELGDIQVERRFRALARGRGLVTTRVWSDLSAGGAVGAVLGGRGACGAPKWEL